MPTISLKDFKQPLAQYGGLCPHFYLAGKRKGPGLFLPFWPTLRPQGPGSQQPLHPWPLLNRAQSWNLPPLPGSKPLAQWGSRSPTHTLYISLTHYQAWAQRRPRGPLRSHCLLIRLVPCWEIPESSPALSVPLLITSFSSPEPSLPGHLGPSHSPMLPLGNSSSHCPP